MTLQNPYGYSLGTSFHRGVLYDEREKTSGTEACREAECLRFRSAAFAGNSRDYQWGETGGAGLSGAIHQRGDVLQAARSIPAGICRAAGATNSGEKEAGGRSGAGAGEGTGGYGQGIDSRCGGSPDSDRDRSYDAASLYRRGKEGEKKQRRRDGIEEGEAEKGKPQKAEPKKVAPREPRRRHHHIERISRANNVKNQKPGHTRGFCRQKETRTLEQDVRKRALALTRCLCKQGKTVKESADRLSIEALSLQSWRRDWRTMKREAKARGRPSVRSSREARQALLQTLHELGPETGIPALIGLYRNIPKREIENILWRYRKHYHLRHSALAHELRWAHPGAVWAMDYTDPPSDIDDYYEDIFVNRDLASGFQLDALPVVIETAYNTASALKSRFIQYGAPLVIKRDNGSTLSGEPIPKLLEEWGVHVLASPIQKPQYNGSCEAGNGSIKTRAHHIASRNGRAGHWTCDDIEESRCLTNATARPKGPEGPTPEQAWEKRQRITETERQAFDKAVSKYLNEARLSRECLRKREGNPKAGFLDATLKRDAVRRALEHCGYLSYRRRRITQP